MYKIGVVSFGNVETFDDGLPWGASVDVIPYRLESQGGRLRLFVGASEHRTK
jgi:hypothetical protein